MIRNDFERQCRVNSASMEKIMFIHPRNKLIFLNQHEQLII